MAEAKKLGELLIEAGLIDNFQLESALSHQRNWGGKLGAILVELEFAREEDVAKVLAEKLRLPYADLFDPPVADAVLRLLKSDIVRKYVVMPVRKEGNALVVAMSNPLDIETVDSLRFATGLTIKPALALESEVKLAIRKYYDKENVVRKPAVALRQAPGAMSGKMEIIHGSDLSMPKADRPDAANPILTQAEASQQVTVDNKIRIDALISILIEKGIISRDELMSMIYQKKMGL